MPDDFYRTPTMQDLLDKISKLEADNRALQAEVSLIRAVLDAVQDERSRWELLE